MPGKVSNAMRKLKTTVLKLWTKMYGAALLLSTGLLMPQTAFASSVDDINTVIAQKTDVVFLILCGIVASLGGICILWGVLELAEAIMQTQDTNKSNSAQKRIIAGIVMLCGGAIVALIKAA